MKLSQLQIVTEILIYLIILRRLLEEL